MGEGELVGDGRRGVRAFAHWLHLVVAMAWQSLSDRFPMSAYMGERFALHRWGIRGVAVGTLMHERDEFFWKDMWRQ